MNELIDILYGNTEAEQTDQAGEAQRSAADAASHALAEILESETIRSEIPDWFGPMEQLCNQVVFAGVTLIDESERILSEIAGHGGHSHSCRCAELRDVLVQGILPALAESNSLLLAIETLRRQAGRTPNTELDGDIRWNPPPQ